MASRKLFSQIALCSDDENKTSIVSVRSLKNFEKQKFIHNSRQFYFKYAVWIVNWILFDFCWVLSVILGSGLAVLTLVIDAVSSVNCLLTVWRVSFIDSSNC